MHLLKGPEKIKLIQNKKWYNSIFTIINGDNGTAFDVTEDTVTIKNLMIISSEKGIYVNGI